jgi:hypothetical protein
MPLSPPLVLEVGSGTKFPLLPFFDIVGPFLGLTRNLGAHHIPLHFHMLLPIPSFVIHLTIIYSFFHVVPYNYLFSGSFAFHLTTYLQPPSCFTLLLLLYASP